MPEMWLLVVLSLFWAHSLAQQDPPLTNTESYEATVTADVPLDNRTNDDRLIHSTQVPIRTQSRLQTPDSTSVLPESSIELQTDNPAETEDEFNMLDKTINVLLREGLKNLSEVMRNGDPRLGIPSLDPLLLENLIVQPMISGERFDVHVRNIRISPLSSFRIKELESEIRESRIRLAVYYPRLAANCEIDANGTLFDIFTITGKGNATIEFHEVHARTMVYLTREGNRLKVSTADQPFVDFSRSTVKFHGGRERVGRKVISTTVASQFGPLFFWMFSVNIVEIIDYHLANYVNDILARYGLPSAFNSLSIPIRYLRVHLPHHPIPYGYVSPVYFHPKSSNS